MNHIIIYLVCISSIVFDSLSSYYKINIKTDDSFFKYLTIVCQIYLSITNVFIFISYILKKSEIYLITLKEFGLRTFFLLINSIIELRDTSLLTSYFYILSYFNWVINILKLFIFKNHKPQTNKVEFTHIEHNFIVIDSHITLEINEACSICLETVQNTKCYKTKCNHIFHTECMKNMLILHIII
jgi:hypothetical protein